MNYNAPMLQKMHLQIDQSMLSRRGQYLQSSHAIDLTMTAFVYSFAAVKMVAIARKTVRHAMILF